MKLRDWTIPAVLLLGCGNVVLAENGASTSARVAARIRVQEARVPQIEALAARDREQVEQWYRARQDAVIREITRAEAARFPLAQREIWVQYAGPYLGRPYAAEYVSPGFIPSIPIALLNQAMYEEYLISEMADVLASGEFGQKLEQLVQERLEVRTPNTSYGGWEPASYLPLLQRRAQELLIVVRRVRTQAAIELTQLANQRDVRLGAIMEWENDLKEQVRGILEYLRQSESRPVRFGVVESVGYCPSSGYYCTIEGVDKVLTTGDRIGRIRVLKIGPEQVEFTKDGTTWAQALGASAQPFWD